MYGLTLSPHQPPACPKGPKTPTAKGYREPFQAERENPLASWAGGVSEVIPGCDWNQASRSRTRHQKGRQGWQDQSKSRAQRLVTEEAHSLEPSDFALQMGELYLSKAVKTKQARASLVTQWLRICLPLQGTRVQALVWEDPTCRGATKPVSHNY